MNSLTRQPRLRALPPPGSQRCGTATIEFAIGLVGVLVVVLGLLQLGTLGRERTRALLDARAAADARGASSTYRESLGATMQYLYDWETGPDERAYSKDDEPVAGSVFGLNAAFEPVVKPNDLAGWIPENPVSELQQYQEFLGLSGFVWGESGSVDIPVHPGLQRLVYQSPEIEVSESAGQVWIEGLLP